MINNKFLLSVAVAAVIFTGCGEDKQSTTTQEAAPAPVKVETPKEVKKVEETTTQKVTATVDTVAKKVEQIAQKVQEKAPATIEAAAQKVDEVTTVVMESAPEAVKEKLAEAQKVVADVAAPVVAAAAPVIEAVKEAAAPKIDGAALYSKCAGCHGASAEKVALGKSKVIKGWDATTIADSLKGYKAGTYGGAMKGIMKGQVASMSDAEIDALSAHIATF